MYIFTIFLAVAWYMTANIETMPSSSQAIPLYTYFLAASLISLSLLCLSLCFTIACYYIDPEISNMPKWIRVSILGYGSKLFGVDVRKKISAWREELDITRKFDTNLFMVNDLEPMEQQSSGNASQENEPNDIDDDDDDISVPSGKLWAGNNEQPQLITDIFNGVELRQLHALIEEYLKRLEGMEDSKWDQYEWELVAEILDRMFLYFFLSVLAFTMFCCTIHVLQLDGYLN